MNVEETVAQLAKKVIIQAPGFLIWTGLNTSRGWMELFATLFFGVVWILFIVCFQFYFQLLAFFTSIGAVNDSSWGLGQIVGLTVWIPAIIEYANLEIRK